MAATSSRIHGVAELALQFSSADMLEGDSASMRSLQRSGTSFQLIFPSAISSQATLDGEPRLGRVTQPGLRNRTRPRLSLRGTCVCPCRRTSTSSGGRSGGTCCRRNFNPPRTRSRTNRPLEIAVAISAHNDHGRSDRPQLVKNRFRANIAKMPDLISVLGHLPHALRQTIVRVGENKDA